MDRHALLERMESILEEVIENPEIVLAIEEDAEDGDKPVENTELDEPEEDDASESIENRIGKKAVQVLKSKGKKGKSIMVKCDDDEDQLHIGKWLMQALPTAVNPIATKFNLRLKLNLDLDMAASDGKQTETKDDPEKPKPSVQLPREADSDKMEELQEKRAQDKTKIDKLNEENSALKKDFSKLEKTISQLKSGKVLSDEEIKPEKGAKAHMTNPTEALNKIKSFFSLAESQSGSNDRATSQ